MNGDDDERPRRSWREIDRMRDGTGGGRDAPRPRGAAAEARSRQATRQYLKQLDGLFSDAAGGAGGARLAAAVREAHGTPGLAAACAAYRDALGFPAEPDLVSLFLDAGDDGLVRGALEALLAARSGGAAGPLPAGLRSQLRLLSDHSDDAIAGAAEDLLDA